MKNNLEVLEEIMKPYFDKKKEIESIEEYNRDEDKELLIEAKKDIKEEIKKLIAKRKEEKRKLELRLERLRENKNREIEEYISSSPSFYAGHSVLRKDLEQSYKAKEDELLAEISAYDKATQTQIQEMEDRINLQRSGYNAYPINLSESKDLLKNLLEKNREFKEKNKEISELDSVVSQEKANRQRYTRVDLRELFEIKGNLRKQLIAEQKRLNFELKQQQINFDSAMLKLDAFKYEYNDQQQVINGAEWRKIYESSNEISDKMNEIRNALKKVEEYLNLTEPTKEETAAAMMSMTPLEQAEYDRRKNISSNSDGNNGANDNDSTLEDVVEINDPVTSKYEEKDGNIVVEDMENLLKTIYNEIVKEAMKLNSVKISGSKEKLGKDEYYISSKKDDEDYKVSGTVNFSNDDGIKLPCGEYINSNDINEAVNNLFNKTKGRTYIVKETGKEYKISRLTVEKLKQKFKKCSTIKLVKDKKISKLDLLKVFGKQKSDSIVKEVEIGELMDSELSEGDYINRNELIANLDNLFTNKKLDWLRNFSDTLKSKKDNLFDKFKKKQKDEEYIIDDDFHIKQK